MSLAKPEPGEVPIVQAIGMPPKQSIAGERQTFPSLRVFAMLWHPWQYLNARYFNFSSTIISFFMVQFFVRSPNSLRPTGTVYTGFRTLSHS